MDLDAQEVALVAAGIAAVAGLLASVVSRNGAKYSARTAARQRVADNQLLETRELLEALSEAAAAGNAYALNIADVPVDHLGQAHWAERWPLAEPVLRSHGNAMARRYVLPDGDLRKQVEKALSIIIDTTQGNAKAGRRVWAEAMSLDPNAIDVAQRSLGEHRRALLSIDVTTRRGRRQLAALVTGRRVKQPGDS